MLWLMQTASAATTPSAGVSSAAAPPGRTLMACSRHGRMSGALRGSAGACRHTPCLVPEPKVAPAAPPLPLTPTEAQSWVLTVAVLLCRTVSALVRRMQQLGGQCVTSTPTHTPRLCRIPGQAGSRERSRPG